MSSYKTHIVVGFILNLVLVFTLLFFKIITLELILLISIPIIFIYSQLPDIDQRNSSIVRILLIVATMLINFGFLMIYIPAITQKLNLYIPYLSYTLLIGVVMLTTTIVGIAFNHRGWTHSVTAGLIVSLPLIYFHWILALIAFISFFSHLALDNEINLA